METKTDITVNFVFFFSVHLLNTVKEIQLMHNDICLFINVLVPQHVSANIYTIVRGYYFKLHKVCIKWES
jgi:hypothetical protein